MPGFATIAEYRGIAIIEKDGDKVAVWNGKKYFTDGLSYLFFEHETGKFGTAAWPSETAVKRFIDLFRDSPDEVNYELRQNYYSYRQAWEALNKKPYKGDVPEFVWNEGAGIFIRFDGVRDGQHRHQ